MTSYTVQFDRIGRNHEVPDLTVTGAADQVAEAIYRYARPKLRSRDVEVAVDLEELRGHIFCGMQTGGTFELSETNVTAVSA